MGRQAGRCVVERKNEIAGSEDSGGVDGGTLSAHCAAIKEGGALGNCSS
jgi:hypothetical protein